MAEKESVEVVYEGYLATVWVPSVGAFERGVPKEVSAEDAKRLLSAGQDFNKVTTDKKKEAKTE